MPVPKDTPAPLPSFQHLILLRGNSGSGKTTAAQALRCAMRERFGRGGTMLVSQDVIRIDLLDVRDTGDNESITLIREICAYGQRAGKHVILEGILDRWKYGAMLSDLLARWQRPAPPADPSAPVCQAARGQTHVYYYDVPLEITLDRHDTRPQKDLFTKEDMRRWYNTDNRLHVPGEQILTADLSVSEAVARMLRALP
ncbi:MAG: hypothetical protein LBJ11_01785 [Oscillospiraceae bacterium]|jgi:energy-coupling factor transporter ATP-binding protein EcfA2|nr:hypothetical protein [Oscillospiraceae bacterium]